MTDPMPEISVVVPALNAAETIHEQLAALAAQEFASLWELIVVDNGSTDRTAEIAHRSSRHPRCTVRVVSEPRRGLNVARNAGTRAATSDRIAICDADDVVEVAWLGALHEGLDDYDLVGGSLRSSVINSADMIALRGWDEGDHPRSSIGKEFGFLDQVICGNVAFRRNVWVEINGFDEAFVSGGDDVDFAWRAQLRGFSVGYRADAVLRYRARSDKRSLFRQYVRDGEGSAHLYSIYRAQGMPGRKMSKAIRAWAWTIRNLHVLVRGTPAQQGHVLRVIGKQWGRIRGSFKHRVIYL